MTPAPNKIAKYKGANDLERLTEYIAENFQPYQESMKESVDYFGFDVETRYDDECFFDAGDPQGYFYTVQEVLRSELGTPIIIRTDFRKQYSIPMPQS